MNEAQIKLLELKNELLAIKAKGYIPCTRPNNKDGGIGNTLEDLLGVQENNFQLSDYKGFELKTQRTNTTSNVSLFSMATENGRNRELFDKYHHIKDDVKRFYCSIYMNKNSILHGKYITRLKFDNEANPEHLIVEIKDLETGEILDEAYWNIEKIKNKIMPKMKNLVISYADVKPKKMYHFNSFQALLNFDFNKFLDQLRLGNIVIDFRIGADLNGKNAGKYHDHGTGFRIKASNLDTLYSHTETF